jgi:SAM-dependent methyltransferase
MEKSFYKKYYTLERKHWWFRVRLLILDYLYRRHIFKSLQDKVLNAGAATGATSEMLKRNADVKSLEYDAECASFLSEILQEPILNDSLTSLPIKTATLDVVCAFDVIEHIDDHQLAVSEMHRVLKENGSVFITVPAYSFLWSEHDEVNHHFRRYTMSELQNLLVSCGFQVKYKTYFNSLLFPFIFMARMAARLKSKNLQRKELESDFEGLNSNELLNKVLFQIFRLELFLIRFGLRFPIGVSALIIATKSKKPASKNLPS